MRRIGFIIASILVSGIFLWFALQGVKFEEVIASISQANPGWIIISFILLSFGMWTRGYRWYGLLDFKVPYWRTANILNFGFMLNVIPLRVGEVARSLLVMREGVPVVTAATSVVVERLLDTLLVVIMIVVVVSNTPDVPAEITRSITLFGAAVVVAFGVLVFFSRSPQIGRKVLEWVERPLPILKKLGLNKLFDNLLDGLKPLTHWRSAIHAVGWTLISWTLSYFTLFALIASLSLTDANGIPLTLYEQLLLTGLGLGLTSLSIAVPVTVGGIGPFQAAILLAGQVIGGVPQAQGLALGFLFQGINIAGYMIWGVVGLLVLGVSLSDVLNADKAKPAESVT